MKNKLFLLLFLSTIQAYSIDIFQAIESGDKRAINKWLKSAPDISKANDQGETPLIAAVKSGNLSLVRRLAQKRVCLNNIDQEGFAALDWAIYLGEDKIITILIKYKAQVAKKEYRKILSSLRYVKHQKTKSRIASAIMAPFAIIGAAICACFGIAVASLHTSGSH